MQIRPAANVSKPKKGLNEQILRDASSDKGEPDQVMQMRLGALRHFETQPLPTWGGDLSEVSLDDIFLNTSPPDGYVAEPGRRTMGRSESGGDLEAALRRTREELNRLGVIACDMDSALRDHPELVTQYLGSVVPMNDNKFSALNTAVWSGGSFVYVPPGVEVDQPLPADMLDGARRTERFQRTLIVADEGSKIHYMDGCSAPVYSSDSLHAGVVEIVVKQGAHVKYTTIQNWSSNVFNLATKRAKVEAEGHMEWVDGNIGSRLTMTYPAVWLVGRKASGEVRSLAYAGRDQHQNTGARMIHAAPETTSEIVSRLVSKNGGRASHRGLVRVGDGVVGCVSRMHGDGLVLDGHSAADHHPALQVGTGDALVERRVTASELSDQQLFYLMSRGLAEEQAIGLMVNGFIEPVTRALPMEYAVEWSRLIELQLEGTIG